MTENCVKRTDCSCVGALLTDLYQITMCYGYWKVRRHNDFAVFDLFFRKNPFGGEFTIFCGLSDVISFIRDFSFTDEDIAYLKTVLPSSTEDGFFDFLRSLTCQDVKLCAVAEGSVVFPRVPLITVEGPLAVCQLLETTLLTLVNYASLVCTNAARFRLAAGDKVTLLEFGLRRAQGPNGGLTASKYCYIGGFDATSNVLAGKYFGIPVRGTHAHSFVSSFTSEDDLVVRELRSADGKRVENDFYKLSVGYLDALLDKVDLSVVRSELNQGELVAFCAYAVAFPRGFVALIDTYDILRSGLINFCACALALGELGYRALGVRIDSGDLAYLSKEARRIITVVATHFNLPWLAEVGIVASNDINEETIFALNDQRHEITCYGVGTHLVTCQKQPALGCVFKLVSIRDVPRIKLSQEVEKMTIPGRKRAFRLFGREGKAILDLIALENESPPVAGKQILCRHPFQENKRAFVTPARVEALQTECWPAVAPPPSLDDVRRRVRDSIVALRTDHKRPMNPTPYKVSVTEQLYDFLHSLWLQNAPIGQLE